MKEKMEEYEKRQFILSYLDTVVCLDNSPISQSPKFVPLGVYYYTTDSDMVRGIYDLENNVRIVISQWFRDEFFISLLNLPDTKEKLIEYVDNIVYNHIKRLVGLMNRTYKVMMNTIKERDN